MRAPTDETPAAGWRGGNGCRLHGHAGRGRSPRRGSKDGRSRCPPRDRYRRRCGDAGGVPDQYPGTFDRTPPRLAHRGEGRVCVERRTGRLGAWREVHPPDRRWRSSGDGHCRAPSGCAARPGLGRGEGVRRPHRRSGRRSTGVWPADRWLRSRDADWRHHPCRDAGASRPTGLGWRLSGTFDAGRERLSCRANVFAVGEPSASRPGYEDRSSHRQCGRLLWDGWPGRGALPDRRIQTLRGNRRAERHHRGRGGARAVGADRASRPCHADQLPGTCVRPIVQRGRQRQRPCRDLQCGRDCCVPVRSHRLWNREAVCHGRHRLPAPSLPRRTTSPEPRGAATGPDGDIDTAGPGRSHRRLVGPTWHRGRLTRSPAPWASAASRTPISLCAGMTVAGCSTNRG